jgi:hypothetical protein
VFGGMGDSDELHPGIHVGHDDTSAPRRNRSAEFGVDARLRNSIRPPIPDEFGASLEQLQNRCGRDTPVGALTSELSRARNCLVQVIRTGGLKKLADRPAMIGISLDEQATQGGVFGDFGNLTPYYRFHISDGRGVVVCEPVDNGPKRILDLLVRERCSHLDTVRDMATQHFRPGDGTGEARGQR